MSSAGWHQLVPSADLYRGPGRYPIDAYSEFMPPPRLGWKPHGDEPPDPQLFDPEDPWGWYISEYEEANELRPGLAQVARQVVGRIRHLLRGEHAHAISRRLLTFPQLCAAIAVSISAASAKSLAVRPPSECVLSVNVTVRQRMSMSGW